MKLFKFIFIGLLVTLAGEYQINILVQHKELGPFLGTFVNYAIFLIIFFAFGKVLDKKFEAGKADLIYYFVAGFVGLAIEWFLIGNSIFANPQANQAGMFAWWTGVFMIPRIFTKQSNQANAVVKKKIYYILIPYSILSVLLVSLLPATPETLRIIALALSMMVGFIFVNYYLINYLVLQNPHLQKRLKYFYWFLVILAFINLFW